MPPGGVSSEFLAHEFDPRLSKKNKYPAKLGFKPTTLTFNAG